MFCSPSTVGGTNHSRFPLTSEIQCSTDIGVSFRRTALSHICLHSLLVPDTAHFFPSCVCFALTFYNWEETTPAAIHDNAVTPMSHKDSLSCILAAAQSKRDDFQEAHAAEI